MSLTDGIDVLHVSSLSRPQVDLTFERFRFLAPCQRLRAIVCVLSAHLRRVLKSTCVCLRFREQCLRSEITSVSRIALVLLLRFVASNMDVNTPASKRSQLIGNTAIVRKRCVIHTNSTCVCWRLSVATFTQKRKDASFDLWPPLRAQHEYWRQQRMFKETACKVERNFPARPALGAGFHVCDCICKAFYNVPWASYNIMFYQYYFKRCFVSGVCRYRLWQ